MAHLKTLRVCLSKDLPLLEDRKQDYIYYIYDKLEVFLGQSIYYDPYAIVEVLPDNPISGMLYFCLDGYVRSYIEYNVIDIAKIENNEQLEILKQCGTTFFVNAEKRYLDIQRRIITLPYQNGTYELTVSVANDLLLNKDTVIAFNPETNEFDIVGKREDYDLFFGKGYRGSKSEQTTVTVDNHTIKTDIKISPAYDNIIRFVKDGLYAGVSDRVTKQEFESFRSVYQDYKAYMDSYLKSLQEEIDKSEATVSEQTISKMVREAMEEVFPLVDVAFKKFDEMANEFDGIEERSKKYTDDQIENTYNDFYRMIDNITKDPWENY